jgi:hypothetical protein
METRACERAEGILERVEVRGRGASTSFLVLYISLFSLLDFGYLSLSHSLFWIYSSPFLSLHSRYLSFLEKRQGGEMTQALCAHMNNKTILKKKRKKRKKRKTRQKKRSIKQN